MRELRLKEESGVEDEYELDQAEMNYLEQEVKRITGSTVTCSVGFQQCCVVITFSVSTPNRILIRI